MSICMFFFLLEFVFNLGFAEVWVPGVWKAMGKRKLGWQHAGHFWFLPAAEMTAGIHAPQQSLVQECLQAKCHATGYGIRH